MGRRTDYQAGRTWRLRGRTPVISGTGQRFGRNMISTITNRGRLASMLFTKNFVAPLFLCLLRRLLRHAGRKVFLVVDGHSIRKAAAVRRWPAAHMNRIEVFFLPPDSPDLNPDELPNQDVKASALGRRRPATRPEIIAGLPSYLRSTQNLAAIVSTCFPHKFVGYAT